MPGRAVAVPGCRGTVSLSPVPMAKAQLTRGPAAAAAKAETAARILARGWEGGRQL